MWTAWPHDPDQWLEGLAAPQRALMDMVAAIVDLDDAGRPRGERVELLVRDAGDEAGARALLGGGVEVRVLQLEVVVLDDVGRHVADLSAL